MKVLTVRQPWAWAIIHGGKTIENRTARWRYRGPLAIHAGKGWSERGAEFLPLRQAYAKWLGFEWWDGPWGGHTVTLDPTDPRDQELLDSGAIIGVVDLAGLHPATGCCEPWGEKAYKEAGGKTRRDIYHLTLEHPRALMTPIDWKGGLGLRDVPAELEQEIMREVAE